MFISFGNGVVARRQEKMQLPALKSVVSGSYRKIIFLTESVRPQLDQKCKISWKI